MSSADPPAGVSLWICMLLLGEPSWCTRARRAAGIAARGASTELCSSPSGRRKSAVGEHHPLLGGLSHRPDEGGRERVWTWSKLWQIFLCSGQCSSHYDTASLLFFQRFNIKSSYLKSNYLQNYTQATLLGTPC